ncbi:hypothetical protein C0Q70_17056 [Pomacea canaliculata]|uniref:Uncharacterized protein n=1 Tax=Pomacea canaliculata TaxID=400727 RepID=A0A2T7NRK6_POMCA|nr:hypothetical protein C0Q70_17056 [Pomacea canaliculata]
MFQTMMADVETLMTLKSRAKDHEHEGRASSMRILRHLRDWIEERSLFLDKFCSSTGGEVRRAMAHWGICIRGEVGHVHLSTRAVDTVRHPGLDFILHCPS